MLVHPSVTLASDKPEAGHGRRRPGPRQFEAALASVIIKVLYRRSITVDADSFSRIKSCRNTDMLEVWLDRAVSAAKVGDLFK